MDQTQSKKTLITRAVLSIGSATWNFKYSNPRGRDQYQGRPNPPDFPTQKESKQFKWTLEAVSKLQLHLKQDRQAGARLETVISKWGKPQQFSFTKTAGDAKTQVVLTYAAKQTDQGKKSVSLWFEQVENKGYRLTMVDATNLLEHQDQEASGKKEAGKSKEVQGVDQILNSLGNPQRLVWDELLEGGQGFRASYQEQGQPEVVMEFKVKGSKLIMV